jgi:hypothetical protein
VEPFADCGRGRGRADAVMGWPVTSVIDCNGLFVSTGAPSSPGPHGTEGRGAGFKGAEDGECSWMEL